MPPFVVVSTRTARSVCVSSTTVTSLWVLVVVVLLLLVPSLAPEEEEYEGMPKSRMRSEVALS